jgi:hypothetical protein
MPRERGSIEVRNQVAVVPIRVVRGDTRRTVAYGSLREEFNPED